MNEKIQALVDLHGLGWGWQYTRDTQTGHVSLTIRGHAGDGKTFEADDLSSAAAGALAWAKAETK